MLLFFFFISLPFMVNKRFSNLLHFTKMHLDLYIAPPNLRPYGAIEICYYYYYYYYYY